MNDYSRPPAAPPNPGAVPGFGPAPQFGPPAPGYGPPGGGYGLPTPTSAPAPSGRTGSPGRAVLIGFLVTALATGVYAAAVDITWWEMPYATLLLGLVIGPIVGRIGGRSAALPFVAALLTLLGALAGELIGTAAVMVSGSIGISIADLKQSGVGSTFSIWESGFSLLNAGYYLAGAVVAFALAHRAARRP